jgi:DNA-binding transcriptional regulator/RsmH inhibitor MraZ
MEGKNSYVFPGERPVKISCGRRLTIPADYRDVIMSEEGIVKIEDTCLLVSYENHVNGARFAKVTPYPVFDRKIERLTSGNPWKPKVCEFSQFLHMAKSNFELEPDDYGRVMLESMPAGFLPEDGNMLLVPGKECFYITRPEDHEKLTV